MGVRTSPRNSGWSKDELGLLSTGRHARPAAAPVPVPADMSRERRITERFRAADRTLADAQTRARKTGAGPDAISAFAAARKCLTEAREIVREAHRELAEVQSEWEQLNRRQLISGRYPDSAAPVILDTPGQDLCPDPGNARTAAEFMATLRAYRTWAGEPSYRVMENVIRNQFPQRFAASTIHAALKSDELPALALVRAIITACGGTSTHEQKFTSAWRQLTMPEQDRARPAPSRSICPAAETA